ncbi:MAG: HEAT repeat domain-containing protein [Synechococcaceae cyanobacterium SM2_3_2]|nr:HEAT repeat domain-containing protein [Synechococcaceae cyanobacterium SM2_3_2]
MSSLPLTAQPPEDLLTPAVQIDKLQQGDPGERYYAAWWLGRMRVKSGIPALIKALQDQSDRTEQGGYPLRRNAARALAKLADPSGIPALISCLATEDGQLCGAAAQAISEIALESQMDGLGQDSLCPTTPLAQASAALLGWLQAQDPQDPALSETALEGVIEALGSLHVQSAGPLIKPFVEHSSVRVRCGSCRALFQITGDVSYISQLLLYLQHDNLHLRRGALLDLGATGYLPAAAAMAHCAVEANVKLLALKAMMDAHWRRDPCLTSEVSHVLLLIDGLI